MLVARYLVDQHFVTSGAREGDWKSRWVDLCLLIPSGFNCLVIGLMLHVLQGHIDRSLHRDKQEDPNI